ncbi:sulfatase-like hydrolase/transferase [Herbiconiux sp. A18JL235]|uniref:Sulfatase-like hydrolase/transferase n=1 Tax=Herbiconiux sp. A18JL235 TaxID=3152363 RepID=A0AB39BHC6_9MICO
MTEGRPNVLWIMADELRADALSCYGNAHPEVRTPNMDALAASGVLFERAFASSPVCVPARQAMLSGVSPLISGVVNNEGYTPAGFEPPEMFPEIFAAAGWSTASYGKEHLPGGRSPWQLDDHTGSGMPELLAVARAHGVPMRRSPGIGHVYDAVLPAGAATGSEVITESVITALAASESPFLLRASYVQPHKPMVVPEPWASRYEGVEFDVPRDPDAAQNEFEREWGRLTRGAELSDDELQLSFQRYHGCVAWLDDQVGRILEALDLAGLRESTIVVLGTDHGASLGEHGILAKHTFAPESHRVPLIISWPGTLPAGQRRGDLAVSEDLATTVLGLAGLPRASTMTGRDLFADPAPDTVLSVIGYGEPSSRAFPNRDEGGWRDGRGWPQRVCARTVRYRFDATTRRAGEPVSVDEAGAFLADTVLDPNERVNRIHDPSYSDVAEALAETVSTAAARLPVGVVDADDFDRTRGRTGAV